MDKHTSPQASSDASDVIWVACGGEVSHKSIKKKAPIETDCFPLLQKRGSSAVGKAHTQINTRSRMEVVSGQNEHGKKHRCLIMSKAKLGQTELALRIYFKPLMALPCVGEPSQREDSHDGGVEAGHAATKTKKDKKKTKTIQTFSSPNFSHKLSHN